MIRKLLSILLIAASTVMADETIPFTTGTGKAKVSSSGIGTTTKPYDFSNVTTTGIGGGGGGGTPGGTNGQVQYKFSSSSFGGLTLLSYNNAGDLLTLWAGNKFNIVDPTDITKRVQLTLSGITTGTLRNVNVPNADSTWVIPASAPANQFGTGIGATGTQTFAQVTDANLSTSDVTTNNATIGKHGFVPKYPNDATKYLDGTGAYTVPPGGSGTPGGSTLQLQFNNAGAFGGTTSLVTDTFTNLFATATRFFFQDPADNTKLARLDVSPLPSGSIVAVKVGGNSITVIPDNGAANNFLTGISTTNGAVLKAQPLFSNIGGTIANSQQFIPVGKTLYVDITNGNNTTALPNRFDKPYATLNGGTGALAHASAGDMISISPGTFNESGTVRPPQNVSFVGSGAGVTTIFTTGGIVPGTGDKLADFTIDARTSTNSIPSFAIGADTTDTAFTDVTISGVELLGNTDGFYFNKAGIDRVAVFDCTVNTTWDAVYTANMTGQVDFYDTGISADGSITGASITSGVNATSGTVNIYGGTVSSSNGVLEARGIQSANSGTTVNVHSASINAVATTRSDLYQASSSTLLNDGATRPSGSALFTTGTISQFVNTYEGNLGLTDITTADVSTSKHGFAPKLPNDSTKFLNGIGTYTVPPGGGGSGDVVGPSSSVDSEVALFSGTTGKLIKRATGSGLAKLTSGVQSTVTAPSGAVVGDSDTQTLAAKRINPRVTTAASNATWAPSVATEDVFEITAQAAAVTTISNPAGTPTDGQSLIIRFKDDGTARALTWSGTQWEAGPNQTLPTTTIVGQTDYCLFKWNSTTSKWTMLANSQSTGSGVFDPTVDLALTAHQTVKVNDATTNSTTRILDLSHNTTGTPANGLGPSLGLRGETSTTADSDMAVLAAQWSDVTDATRTAYFDIKLANSATPNLKLRIWGSGGASLARGASPTDPTAGYLDVDQGLKIGGVDLKDATLTWTNKRNTPRVTAITSNATWSPSATTDDVYEITAQAAAATTISNPSGVPVDGQGLTIRFTDNGTARALTWSGTQWEAGPGLVLPSTTIVGQTDYVLFRWNSTTSKWTMVANTQSVASNLNDNSINMFTALGGVIVAQPVGATLGDITTTHTLVDGTVEFVAVYLATPKTLTGVKWYQGTKGNYTGDNNNRIGLYTYSGGTITLVASCANDATLWQTCNSNTWCSKAFSSTYAATAGTYFIGLLYNNSAQTTAPVLGSTGTLQNAIVAAGDFTNSAKIYSTIAGTNLPSPQAMSGTTGATPKTYVALY